MRLTQGWGSGEGFECFRKRAMQRPALACQQLAGDRLSDQLVPKGELVCRLLNNELGRNQLLQQWKQVVFLAVQHLLQQGKVEAPPGYRCQRQHLLCRCTQPIHPLLDPVLHTSRKERETARITLS